MDKAFKDSFLNALDAFYVVGEVLFLSSGLEILLGKSLNGHVDLSKKTARVKQVVVLLFYDHWVDIGKLFLQIKAPKDVFGVNIHGH